jgi:hypothetical protein
MSYNFHQPGKKEESGVMKHYYNNMNVDDTL